MAVIINIAHSKILDRLYFIIVRCLPKFARQDSYFRNFKISKERQIHLLIHLFSHLISVRLDKSIVFRGQRIRMEVYRSQSYGHATL